MSNQAKQSSLPRIGILSTHPIQYYTPLYRALAQVVDLQVFYCHRQASSDHARTEFGVAFEWGVPLTPRPAGTFGFVQGDQPFQFEFNVGNSF